MSNLITINHWVCIVLSAGGENIGFTDLETRDYAVETTSKNMVLLFLSFEPSGLPR